MGQLSRVMRKSLILWTAWLFTLQVSSCADPAAWMRQYTYPPTFHYITHEQLRSTMWRLALHSRELRELMTSPDEIAAQRAEVLQHLRIMEQTMIDLNRTGWPTNHPLFDANRSTFLHDIRTAQGAVSRDPPDLLLAGAVSGACVYCHRNR